MRAPNAGRILLLCALLAVGCGRGAQAPVEPDTPQLMDASPTESAYTGPDWAPGAVLYQINVRHFSREGTLNGVRKQIDRLHRLGVDVLWLMPVQPSGIRKRKGPLGSPYAIRDYRAVDPAYGSLDDVRELVKVAHQKGMKVILDWVPNHTAWDHTWMQAYPHFYTRINGQPTVPLDERGEPIADWSDVAELNYDEPELERAMIGAMTYWLKETDIDGFRMDMAALVPFSFWRQVRPALEAVKPVFLLAECQDHPEIFQHGFHADYGWRFKDVTRGIASGLRPATALDSLYNHLQAVYPEGYYQLYFTQNHDENAWHGAERELFGDAADAMNALMFTWQGMPLIYNGQEAGLDKRLKFFQRDPIRWKNYPRTTFFQQLCDLRHRNRALWSGSSGGKLEKISSTDDQYVYAFFRQAGEDKCLAVFNLSPARRGFQLEVADRMTGPYMDAFGNSTVTVGHAIDLTLEPWSYIVLSNR
jgi:alpha-amylase